MEQTPEVFSTQGFPNPRKAERWGAILGQFCDTVQVWPRDPLHFDGTLIRQRVGRLTLFGISCASIRVRHTRLQAGRSRSPSFQLLMPVQGDFTLTHGDRPAVPVESGSFCLIDRAEPYEMSHGDGLRAIGVEIPRTLLESLLPQATRVAGSVLLQTTGPTRILGALMHSLATELSLGGTESLPSVMARSIASFVATAFADQDKNVIRRGVQEKLAAYREYVESRLGDGDFGPVDVARHFRVSERYVRMVFHSAGEPLSTFLLRRRLDRATKLLRGPEYAHQTLAFIAAECGFNSATHFGQAFRQRYGVTPREYRRLGQATDRPREARAPGEKKTTPRR